jgi:hypothetical protein
MIKPLEAGPIHIKFDTFFYCKTFQALPIRQTIDFDEREVEKSGDI